MQKGRKLASGPFTDPLAPSLQPPGLVALRVSGGALRSLLIVHYLVIGLDDIVLGWAGLPSWATRP